MNWTSLGLAHWTLALAVGLSSVACAAPEEEDGSSGADAISASEAAREFKGADKVGEFEAGADAREIGVASWTVYGVKNDAFAGAVLFAMDADGDVKYAIVSGQRESDPKGKSSLALVNYDKAGKTGATSADKATLNALGADMKSIESKLAKDARDTKDCMTALTLAAGGLVLVAAGWWLAVPASVAAGVGWVSSALFATGTAVSSLGGAMTVWIGVDGADLFDGVRSCGAVIRR